MTPTRASTLTSGPSMARWTVDQRTSRAIATVKVFKGARVVSRGTAFLVGKRACLTALHVVADHRAAPLTLRGDRIVIEFEGNTTPIEASLSKHHDAKLDWALLECNEKTKNE